ncbi:class I SAM-dependent methyltransferase [Kitasatospora sp. NPDC050543]|uniref:class I SAM-dependent methyltransferase n=1 Tax=Kitasatospora sp. NPDC050543 TaxID=3364054 RepID=UPI003795B990
MRDDSVADFYDRLAADYHLIFADWDATMTRQGEVLDAVIRGRLGEGAASVLDCSCGIGTQAIGLALRGHRVTGTDLSSAAVGRAAREAALRGARLPAATADMRRLPFADAVFDVVVCADNSLPHLLTEEDVRAALAEMRRVLRDGGLLVVSTRPYDELLRARPASTPPQVGPTSGGRAVTFQLWHWHDDGERYDLEHFQLVAQEQDWRVAVRRTTYWALTQRQLTEFAAGAGFTEIAWELPEASGFYQPLLTARVPRPAPAVDH